MSLQAQIRAERESSSTRAAAGAVRVRHVAHARRTRDRGERVVERAARPADRGAERRLVHGHGSGRPARGPLEQDRAGHPVEHPGDRDMSPNPAAASAIRATGS